MRFCVRKAALAVLLVLLLSCTRYQPATAHAAASQQPAPENPEHARREVRVTGTVQAVQSFKMQVPQISGNYTNMTLTHIIANGSRVKEGDLIATFDATAIADSLRDAKAKFDDLGHQVDQKRAQNRADAEKRASDLQQAESDLAKARIELKKGPVLSEIVRLENEEKARLPMPLGSRFGTPPSCLIRSAISSRWRSSSSQCSLKRS